MDFKQTDHAPPGRLVGCVLLGIVVGALLPLAAVLQISMLMPVLMLGGIFAAHLKARAGWIPVAALWAAAMAVAFWFMGPTLMLILTVAALLPSLAVMAGMARKAPFFEQMQTGVAAFVGELVAAMLIAYASYGGNMVARFVDALRAEYGRMPDAALQPLVEWMNTLVSSGEVGGMRSVTVNYFRAQLSGVLDLLQQTYAQTLPGVLLSGAALSGVLAVLWGNWTMARRGMATNESFVGISGWFMPARISVGALSLWAAGLIMLYAGKDNGATIYMTIAQLVGAAFALQALSALDRRMLRAGRTLNRRRVMIGLLAAISLLLRGVGAMLSYVGVMSALFGSRGAVKLWMRRRQDDHSDDDDDPY